MAFAIFPIHESNRPLFESVMAVVVTASVVLFATLYFKKVKANFLDEGIRIGGLWLLISLAVDLLMFSSGPMKMTFLEYMSDIGITYLIIPTITAGFGYLLQSRRI